MFTQQEALLVQNMNDVKSPSNFIRENAEERVSRVSESKPCSCSHNMKRLETLDTIKDRTNKLLNIAEQCLRKAEEGDKTAESIVKQGLGVL